MTAAATDRPKPVTHTFTLTVDVDPFWVTYLTQHSTIFGRPQYAGYWAYGAAHDPARGWLVCEWAGRATEDLPDEEECRIVEAAWRAGESLPIGWYTLDRAAALSAWEEGVKMWGVRWYEQVDGPREDVVLQLALLGEVRYG